MVKRKGLLAQVNTSSGLQYSMGNLEQNIYKMKTELEFEIECPRCYDSCEYLLWGHATITAAELFYNRRLSIGAPAPHVNS